MDPLERLQSLPPQARAAAEAIRAMGSHRQSDTVRPYVVAQLGQSLDGRIATVTGDSQWINGDAALDYLHLLRASVDAVIVGAGTVIADDPQLNVRRVPGKPPARVVIDPNARTPGGMKWLRADGARRIVLVANDADVESTAAGAAQAGQGDGSGQAVGSGQADGSGQVEVPGRDQEQDQGLEIVRLERSTSGFHPASILQTLDKLGFRRVLVEGGAVTISRFIDAGLVDRLALLIGPVLIGSGRNGLDLAPIDRLAEAARPQVTAIPLADGDVLFDCKLDCAMSNLSDYWGK